MMVSCSNLYKPVEKRACFSDVLKNYDVGLGDADTSLAVHFWRDFPFEFEENIEDYTRLATEKEKIFKLLYELFSACPNFVERKVDIENSQQKFKNFIIQSLNKEGKENGYLSDSRELYYLKITKDPAYDKLVNLYGIDR
jgi:hypothetical protein